MKIPCPVDDCEENVSVSIDGPDPSVGIFGYAIEEVSGKCEHVDMLNEELCRPDSDSRNLVQRMYASLDERAQDEADRASESQYDTLEEREWDR